MPTSSCGAVFGCTLEHPHCSSLAAYKPPYTNACSRHLAGTSAIRNLARLGRTARSCIRERATQGRCFACCASGSTHTGWERGTCAQVHEARFATTDSTKVNTHFRTTSRRHGSSASRQAGGAALQRCATVTHAAARAGEAIPPHVAPTRRLRRLMN